MSKITKKQARAIAATIADEFFEEKISQVQVEMSEALTAVAAKYIPVDVFHFIKTRPEYIQTTKLMSVNGKINGKTKFFCGYVKTPIPYYPLSIEVAEKDLLPVEEISERMRELQEKRSVIKLAALSKIYKCDTVAGLEKGYPEAYKILVKLEAGPVFKHC